MSKPNAQEDVNKGDLTKKILFSAYGLVKKEDTLRAECEDWNFNVLCSFGYTIKTHSVRSVRIGIIYEMSENGSICDTLRAECEDLNILHADYVGTEIDTLRADREDLNQLKI